MIDEKTIRADERAKCIALICGDCAAGNAPDGKGWHALEVIQGHVAHERMCPAQILRGGTDVA